MAASVTARETVFSLRHQIAKIEGTLPERLAESGAGTTVLRGGGRVLDDASRVATRVPALDEALAGGLPKAALTEIHSRQIREAASAAGFVLALVSLLIGQSAEEEQKPLLWIGTGNMFAEAGFPYVHGISSLFGIPPQSLLFAEMAKPVDALWIAEEAAALKMLVAVILELPGNPRHLNLTATRRLHRRAVEAGRPVFLLRHSAEVEPTAAPLRFIVKPAPAAMRRFLGLQLPGSIGPPAFAVDLHKNRLAPPARFILEWNAYERSFEHRTDEFRDRAQDTGSLVSLSQRRTDMAAAVGSRMEFDLCRFSTAGRQS